MFYNNNKNTNTRTHTHTHKMDNILVARDNAKEEEKVVKTRRRTRKTIITVARAGLEKEESAIG